MKNDITKKHPIEQLASHVTAMAGSNTAIILAALVVLLWLCLGPVLHYSNTWLLLINTVATIVTFLMVFLIQKSQTKDALAIQLKLNELVVAHVNASNLLVSVEDMTEDEMRVLQKYYTRLAERINSDGPNPKHNSDSIQETLDNQP